MDTEELKNNLTYLVKKYISDIKLKDSLLEEIASKSPIGVKGILHEIKISNVPFDASDSTLIKEIVFYYV
jgi:hypothetical protein